jgi:hypothetical protein
MVIHLYWRVRCQCRPRVFRITNFAAFADESGRVTLAAGTWSAAKHGGMPGSNYTAPVPLARLLSCLVTGVLLAVRGRVLVREVVA